MEIVNKVKECRKIEAISISELARRSGLVDKTVKKVENGEPNCTSLTKDKIVRGFNSLENKQRNYTYEYLFPNEQMDTAA